jgi:hypothetical protein
VSDRDSRNPPACHLSRRELLRGAAAGAGLLAVASCRPNTTAPSPDLTPESSKGAPPSTAAATVGTVSDGSGTIRGIVRADQLEVARGEVLRFDPAADTTLELSGNLLVNGRLEMRPEPGVEHVLRFVDVDESAFVGGGLDPLPTDVGLWVMGDGILDIRGTKKRAWNRTGDSDTWRPGDELVVAPVEPGDTTPKPFRSGDPVPSFGDRRAEVLNLTRNARIEGTAAGRAHVFIRSNQPQSIRHVALRHLGPRQADGGSTTAVLGRYGLHFHHAHHGSHGSVVEGVVVRDCGAHAFVPHMSHGISIRDCIAYEVFDEAYWWDPEEPTDDLVIDRCVAASVHADPEERGYRLAGFLLGMGQGLELRRSVAFAVHGNRNASGYVWPEAPSGLWRFEDNLAHNNAFAGIFVWQNVAEPHRIRRFTAYHNGSAGIIHGAYSNAYHYRDLDLRDQATAIELVAASRPDVHGRPQSWTQVRGGGLRVDAHNLPGAVPVLFRDCSFAGGVTLNDGGDEPGPLDFVECGLEPASFTIESLHPETVVRVQRPDGTAFELTPSGVRDIRPFFPY